MEEAIVGFFFFLNVKKLFGLPTIINTTRQETVKRKVNYSNTTVENNDYCSLKKLCEDMIRVIVSDLMPQKKLNYIKLPGSPGQAQHNKNIEAA